MIAERYRTFLATLPGGCRDMQLNPRRLTFGDDVTLIVAWLQENAWSS